MAKVVITSCTVYLFYIIIYCTSNGVHVISSLTSPQVSRMVDAFRVTSGPFVSAEMH